VRCKPEEQAKQTISILLLSRQEQVLSSSVFDQFGIGLFGTFHGGGRWERIQQKLDESLLILNGKADNMSFFNRPVLAQ
jgi:hypothetical protein